MFQTVEAIVRGGQIYPVEPISMEENSRFLLVRLQPVTTGVINRRAGSAKGRLTIIEDDDSHLNDFSDYVA